MSDALGQRRLAPDPPRAFGASLRPSGAGFSSVRAAMSARVRALLTLDLSQRHRAPLSKSSLWQPVIGFGLALIACIWIAAWILIVQDRAAQRLQMERDATNLALVFEQNVAHTVADLDRILHFLRWARLTAPPGAPWSSIISQKFAVDSDVAQIAVIDANGFMITSTADLYPKTPLDLGDREHFRVQVNAAQDNLFISRPVLGRVSGKWSVQFTRRLTDADGRFAGVVVISLDTAHLAYDYADLNLGRGGGLALVGDDGYIRAGTGVFAGVIGEPLSATVANDASATENLASPSDESASPRGFAFVARNVEDFPLKVVVAIPNVDSSESWTSRRDVYVAAAAIVSLLAFFVMVGVAYRHHRFQSRILHLARYDSLTGLPNRQRLGERLDELFMLPAHARDYALHIIDLDRFKFVNDTYGHAIGDELLKVVAERLGALATPADFVARLGGDEFAIVQSAKNYGLDGAAFARRICETLAAPYELGDVKAVIEATVGVASAAADGGSRSELLKAADLALYAMKSDGKGSFRFYDASMARAVHDRFIIENGLRSAIDNDEFQLFYQPIVAADGRNTVGYEALIRWRRPGHGTVSPAEFIPVAEETGLIIKIGDWVIHKACADIATLPPPVRVAVNCSPIQFEFADVVGSVRSALARSGLAPERLEIEITESTLMKDNQRVIGQLRQLRAMGVRVSMDDFGTGYSCLSYLELYPITTIKIDRSFVQKLDRRDGARATIRAIVELAASFNITTIAEGVETLEQLAVLTKLGCAEIQGYLFSVPKPLEDILGSASARPGLPAAAPTLFSPGATAA